MRGAESGREADRESESHCQRTPDRTGEAAAVRSLHSRFAVGWFRCVMFEEAMRLQVTMNQRLNVAVFLGFMHVLGRHDGEQSQRGAQHARKNP